MADDVEVQGVRITHPDKLLWPADGITKLDLARYYERIAPVMLPYVTGRPLTLRPFLRGIDQPGFFMKDAPSGLPPWLETFRDVAGSTGEPVDFVVARDVRALVWLAQRNAIEVHPWLSRVDDPDHPDWAVVDLDPADDPPESAAPHDTRNEPVPPLTREVQVARAALLVREKLAQRGLTAFPKLTGQTGIHVLVPLAPLHAFDRVRQYVGHLAEELATAYPELLTTGYRTATRRGRVLIDYAQNARAKNTVAPYSVRPKPGAPVAVPVTWEELETGNLVTQPCTIRTMLGRLKRVGDLLEPALDLQQRLPLD
jgi:bifunctional non-homologous end joining protein LigD